MPGGRPLCSNQLAISRRHIEFQRSCAAFRSLGVAPEVPLNLFPAEPRPTPHANVAPLISLVRVAERGAHVVKVSPGFWVVDVVPWVKVSHQWITVAVML